MSLVRYELFCVDALRDAEKHPYISPLHGVTGEQLWEAHGMGHVMLNRAPNGQNGFFYKGGPNKLELPMFIPGHAFVNLSIARLDPRSLVAIAELCQSLRCVLVPQDGGPQIAAEVHAIVQELTRRATAALCPDGQSLFELADAAARAAAEARSQASAEARALRESHIKRRKPLVPTADAAHAMH